MKITAGLVLELSFFESIKVTTANCMNMQKSSKTIAGSININESCTILVKMSIETKN